MSDTIKHYSHHVNFRAEKFYKTTLFQAENLMLGLNCLQPGQVQAVHAHQGQDKFYFVLEGSGHFTVGAEVTEAGPGSAVWAKAETPHGVENRGSDSLVILVGIAPSP